MKIWPDFFVWLLPAKFVQLCAVRVWAETTTGPYGNTIVSELTMSDGIARFGRIHGIPGHGKDEFFDSNRKNVKGVQG